MRTEDANAQRVEAAAQRPLFLTPAELQELTGSPQKSRQIAWLKKEKIKHRVNLGGHPVVTWRAVDGWYDRIGKEEATPNWEGA